MILLIMLNHNQMKNHEWCLIGNWLESCIHCDAIRIPDDKNNSYIYPSIGSSIIGYEEPECIERPE